MATCDNKYGAKFPRLRDLVVPGLNPGQSLAFCSTHQEELRKLLTAFDRMAAIGSGLYKDMRDELDEAESAVGEVRRSVRHVTELFSEFTEDA